MRLAKTFLLSLPVVALALADASDAHACGGCFVSESESTQVTGHRMILSVSSTSTTLWDQIEYSGKPSSFAWVLPTKGLVEIGLSSDALFENIQARTDIQISSPVIQCPQPPFCGNEDGSLDSTGSSATSGAGGASGTGGVDVIAHEVVGPYETVQLSSTDPAALQTWLADHGYKVPTEIGPIIDQYVTDGFNFLALKLVPGQGIDSMKPVRVTTPGAVPVLPLRMVAAGTGATTPLLLWVMGEGRYEPGNFPSFTIPPEKLIWNWDTSTSNYTELMQAEFDASKGFAWLTQAAEQFPTYDLEQTLTSLAQYSPVESGYADDMGMNAEQNCKDDLAALFGGLVRENAWVTRLYTELSRPALKTDLEVGASTDQTPLERYFQTVKSVGHPPPCPTYPPCPGSGADDAPGTVSSKGCTLSGGNADPASEFALIGAMGLLIGLGLRRRR